MTEDGSFIHSVLSLCVFVYIMERMRRTLNPFCKQTDFLLRECKAVRLDGTLKQ